MPCTNAFDLTVNTTPVPGIPNPSPRYDLLVAENGQPQKAPKGWKIPSCYFDLAGIATAIGTLTVTTSPNTATFTSVTNNVTTVINVPVIPTQPSPLATVATQAQPPVTTQFIGGGNVLLTEPAGWLPVTIGGKVYAMPLFDVVTP